MVKDYLIVAWLTVLACWPVTLGLIAVAAGTAFYTGHRMIVAIMLALFTFVSFAAWDFVRYM